MPAIRKPPQRNSEQRVEHGKSGAVQKPEVGIAQRQVFFDIVGEDRKYLPINEVEHVNKNKHAEDIPAVSGNLALLGLLVTVSRCRTGFRHQGLPLQILRA